MNRIHSLTAKTGLVALTLFALLPCPAHAQDIFFPNDATINYAVPGDAVLGYANANDFNNFTNPTRPHVSFENGASAGAIDAYGGSFVTLTGGTIGQDFVVDESSQANMSGGSVGRFLLVGGDYYGFGRTLVNISGGSFGAGFDQSGESTVNFSGGTFGGISTLGDVNSVFNMSGGVINGDLNSFTGTINMSGGSVENFVIGDGIGNIRGGDIGGYLAVTRTGTLTLYGTDLTQTLVDPDSQEGSLSVYALNGHLLDGTLFVNKEVWVGNIMGSQFIIVNTPTSVPEPNMLVMGGLSLCSFLALRRKRR